MKVLEIGSGSTVDTSKNHEDYHVRFMPVCALADVFLDLVPPDKYVKNRVFGEFIVADVQQLPFHSESFDEIYARHLIEHVENFYKALQECYRLLKSKGRLFVYTPNYYSKYATCKRPMARETDPTHINVFTNMRLSLYLKKIGFKYVSLKSQIATYYPIPAYARWLLNFFFGEEIRLVATK